MANQCAGFFNNIRFLAFLKHRQIKSPRYSARDGGAARAVISVPLYRKPRRLAMEFSKLFLFFLRRGKGSGDMYQDFAKIFFPLIIFFVSRPIKIVQRRLCRMMWPVRPARSGRHEIGRSFMMKIKGAEGFLPIQTNAVRPAADRKSVV